MPKRTLSESFEVGGEFNLTIFYELNKRLWGVVFPAILSQLVLTFMETVGMMFVGSLEDTYATAGVGLGLIYVNVLLHSTLTGLNNPISILVAVAYGKNDIKDCERILMRGRIISIIAWVPLFFVSQMCYPFLVTLGVEPEVAKYSQQFCTMLYFAMGFHM